MNISLLYQKRLKPRLLALEAQRKLVLGLTMLQIGLVMAGVLVVMHFIQHAMLLLPILVIGTAVVSYYAAINKRSYIANYKRFIVREIVKASDEGYQYRPTSFVDAHHFLASGLFPQTYDKFSGDDLITGKIGQTDFEFSEIHAQIETESRNSKGQMRARYETVFRGLFMHANFNKELGTATYVVPESRLLFDRLNHRKATATCRPVALENIEFEKHFAVMSFDQIEARYVLTPKMMEAMVDIKRSMPKNQFYFAFLGHRMYCGVKMNQTMFEPSVFRSGVNMADVTMMVKALRLIKLVITEMDLNTRIWTKS